MIAVSARWLSQVHDVFDGEDRDEVLRPSRIGLLSAPLETTGSELYGPFPRFVGSVDSIGDPVPASGYEFAVQDLEALSNLLSGLAVTEWPNAAAQRGLDTRPVQLVSVARHSGAIVGMANATADSDTLWQIGIDVAEQHRGKRLASVLTANLARAIIKRGRVPYHGTTAANVPSMRAALTAGLKVAWVEIVSRRPI